MFLLRTEEDNQPWEELGIFFRALLHFLLVWDHTRQCSQVTPGSGITPVSGCLCDLWNVFQGKYHSQCTIFLTPDEFFLCVLRTREIVQNTGACTLHMKAHVAPGLPVTTSETNQQYLMGVTQEHNKTYEWLETRKKAEEAHSLHVWVSGFSLW